jgi:DtxR family Mn-dependent transcriptional regulator
MRGRVSGRAEDYLRAVYEIVQQKGHARTNDISKELNVQQPTVVEMVKKLHNRGFVIYEKYGGISLTPHGKDIVKIVKKRHDTFQKFLKLISVPEDIASTDADVLEHLLHPETILQFERFVDFIGHASAIGHPRFVERWMEQFKEYCEKEKQNARARSQRAPNHVL